MDTLTQLANRLSGRVIVSSDISESDIADADFESLIAHITDYFGGSETAGILTKQALAEILEKMKEEKSPIRIEINRVSDFEPVAKEFESNFSIRQSTIERTSGRLDDFVSYLNDRFRKIREIIESGRGNIINGRINSIDKLKEYANGREVSIIGMVYDKRITKNDNIFVTIEDETGTAKVIFMKEGFKHTQDLFENAKKIIKDDIIAVRGKVSGPFVIANAILWPDIPIRPRKTSKEDVAVGFVSDVHIGSKLFMEKNFSQMLRWLNGNLDYMKELAAKIKYLVISGDLVDGIGVYPNQDKELIVSDIYKQYSIFFDFIASVPDYIHTFILAGNHDAVQSTEPQPALGKDLINDFKMDNVHLVTNPSYIKLHGVNILAYHGTSLDSVIQSIPGCSYAKPEVAMTELLKRRHLSPIYGGNKILPTKSDALVIDEVPDILNMGHIHKNGAMDYHGTLVVNSGTWQSRTSFQIKQGHLPSPALMPVYEMKSSRLTTVDFKNIE
ncbi:MAG: DNA-directed DNA polymerase II small subunit [Candidatus Micrarchaeia archaeon]